MAHPQKVLLYGSSLFIECLQASLEPVEELELERVEARLDLLRKRLDEYLPTVLILELGAAPGDFGLVLLKEFPHLTLIGVDLESDNLMVLSIQQEAPLAVADLVRVIRQQAEGYNEPG
jgi:hypothetical protein